MIKVSEWFQNPFAKHLVRHVEFTTFNLASVSVDAKRKVICVFYMNSYDNEIFLLFPVEAKITAYHIFTVPLMFSFLVSYCFSLVHTKLVIYYYFSSSIFFLSSLFL